MGYSCCKTKPFASYVCVNCMDMVHKSCLSRARGKYKILNGHLIECCRNKQEISNEIDQEILETTIRELSEETLLKTERIEKLKHDHRTFLEEALQNEEELNNIIKTQKENNHYLMLEMRQLKEEINKYNLKEFVSTSTQTFRPRANSVLCQTLTTTSSTESQTDSDMVNIAYIPEEIKHSNGNPWSAVRTPSTLPNNRHYSKHKSTDETKPKVIMIADKNGRHCGKLLDTKIGDKYAITAIIKPEAEGLEIFKTYHEERKKLSEKDTIILWWDHQQLTDHKELMQNICLINKCKTLIISQPYLHSQSWIEENDIIYLNNKKLLETCKIASKYNKIEYLDCNTILRKRHFKNGYLTNSGKIALLKNVMNLLISGSFTQPVLTSVHIRTNTGNTSCDHITKLHNHNKKSCQNQPSTSRPDQEEFFPVSPVFLNIM